MSIITPPSEGDNRATTTEEYYNTRTFSPVLKTNRIVLTNVEEQKIKVRIDFSLNLIRPSSAPSDENTISRALLNLDYENLFLVFVAYDNTSTSRVGDMFNGQSNTSFSDLFKGPEGHQFAEKGGIIKRLSDVVEEVLSRPARQVAASGYYNSQNIEYEYSSTVQLDYDSSELVEAQDLTELFLLGGICLIPPPEEGEDIPEIPNIELSYSMPITELTYDKLADFNHTPDPYGGHMLTISPSRVRSIFYINDPRPEYAEVNLKPYSGPYSQDPDTGEWYAGVASGLALGPRLEIRNTINRKVSTSDQLWTTPESIVGLSSIGQYQSTGEDLNNFIKTLNNISANTYTFNDSIMKATQMTYFSRESQKDKTNSVITPWSREATWLYKDPDETDDDLQSSYNCIIGIRFFDLIAQNSLLGFLLKTHLQLWKSGQMESGAIINEILASSNIIKMSISRRRLTNSAFDNNDQDSRVYGDFQQNQINVNIADLYDNLTLQSYYSSGARSSSAPLFESPAVSVEEVEMDWQFYTPQEEAIQDEDDDFQIDSFLTRSFLVKDYEMFYNLDFGKYTYDVEIYANDGIKKVLDTHINSLSEKLLNLDRNIKILSQPIIWNDNKTIVESGYYDQYRRVFFNISDELLEAYLDSVQAVMAEVNRSFCLITGVPNILPKVQDVGNNNEDQVDAFLSLLNPRGNSTTLDAINLFYEKSKSACEVLKGVLRDTFFTTATYDSGTLADKAIRNTQEIHVPNATGHNSCIIHKKAKTGIVHDASETNKLVANYDFPFSSLLSEFGNFMRNATEQAERARSIANIGRGRPDVLGDRNITMADLGSVSFPNVYADDLVTFENPYTNNVGNFRVFDLNFVPNSFETIVTPTLNISIGNSLQKSYTNIGATNTGLTSTARSFSRTGGNVGTNYKVLGSTNQSSFRVTNQQYNSSNAGAKSNIDAKLFVSSQSDANLTGAATKDNIYNYSLVSAGEDTRFTGTTGGAIKVEDIALQAFSIVGVEGEDSLLTDEVKSAIVGAIVESKSDIEFIDNIQNKYKDLIDMRETLGKMFQVFNRISTLNISNSVFGGQKTYKKIFEDGLSAKEQTKLDIQVGKNKFNDESCKLYTLSPKGEKIKISKLPEITKTTRKGSVQKIALVKAEKVSVGENNTNRVAKVNNATLLRL